ncbi:hypothetical protein ACHQM5_004848 [Ranunculus cassubicifolius]
MEAEAVRRRMNMITSHLGGNEDLTAAHLLPMNCSSSMHTVTRRHDNRMLFARQGSTSQAYFMRQSLGELNSSPPTVPATSKPPASKDSSYKHSGAPLFSRPAYTEPDPRTVEYRPAKQESQMSVEEPPKFSRPYRGISTQNQIISKDIKPEGIKLSPRMDVAESARNYAIFLELPGVTIDNIRVEVDDRNLIVTGTRPTQCLAASSGSKDSIRTYQKKDDLQGPYHIVWPLPNDVKRDRISAELLNGVLRITLPKY